MYNKFKKKKVKKMFQFMFTNKNLFILILIKKMMDKMSKKKFNRGTFDHHNWDFTN